MPQAGKEAKRIALPLGKTSDKPLKIWWNLHFIGEIDGQKSKEFAIRPVLTSEKLLLIEQIKTRKSMLAANSSKILYAHTMWIEMVQAKARSVPQHVVYCRVNFGPALTVVSNKVESSHSC